ncbi:LAMI_0H03664g1_1 [Lachancea mirantina]|uniref:Sulfhydryl oxidase n=1 Tax=Lachancea mirantina TaxID=1230905 RepID=A0A1G4KEC0_9SACH|nr:LAMI_0H03664g1_1 [Lachancea mirantina]
MIYKQRLVSIVGALALILLWYYYSSEKLSYTTDNDPGSVKIAEVTRKADFKTVMPSMPDQESKEKLGRASWTYFHTLLARFPDEPTQEERLKLATFLQLYAELYPCGECSKHFVKMLQRSPPQTSSRVAAAMWGCHMHNLVNEHLKKPLYDCSNILDDYDCGCGDGDGKIVEELKLNRVSLEKEDKQRG